MTTANLSSLVPTTELEAVNYMLASNGESPAESLTTPLAAHVDMAYQLLKTASRAIQSRGWQCNSVMSYPVTIISHADVTHPDEVVVPSGALRIRKSVTDAQRGFDISHREGYLWNRRTNTAKFLAAEFPSGLLIDIVFALDFVALPETLRQFIFITAARSYAEKSVGNPDLSGFLRGDETLAFANLVDAEGLAEPTSVLESHKDQRQANAAFDKVSKEVQSIGWHFNTRKNVGITPTSGTVVLPTGTLQAIKTDRSDQAAFNVAHRGLRMFDVVNDTYTFTSSTVCADGKLYVDLIMYLSDPSDLPECARRYIEIKTARQFQPQRQTGGAAQAGYTERDEYRAFRELQDAQGLIEDNNLMVNIDTYRTMFGRFSIYGSTQNLR